MTSTHLTALALGEGEICTFDYTFFDEISDEHRVALSRARWLQVNATNYPDYAVELAAALEEQLAILDH